MRATILIIALCLLLAGCGKENPTDWNSFADGEYLQHWHQGGENPESSEGEQSDSMPWDEGHSKQPGNYTWDEYDALTDDQKLAFQEHLGLEGFGAWLKKAADVPWDETEAKRPEDYTVDDYDVLTDAKKLAFWYELGAEGFEDWLMGTQSGKEEFPWEQPGAKQPKDYTWAEFAALTGAQQMAFQAYLGTDGFDAWLERSQERTETNPWDVPGAKQPEDYTWAEFEALTGAQQIAFQAHLGTDGFDAWLERVQGLE